ncbi:hypothetical protein V6N13_130696 [Hibiscus sabdariffa]
MLLTLDISVGDNDKNMLSAQVMSDTVVPDSYAGIDSLSINRLWKDNKWEDLRVIEVDSQLNRPAIRTLNEAIPSCRDVGSRKTRLIFDILIGLLPTDQRSPTEVKVNKRGRGRPRTKPQNSKEIANGSLSNSDFNNRKHVILGEAIETLVVAKRRAVEEVLSKNKCDMAILQETKLENVSGDLVKAVMVFGLCESFVCTFGRKIRGSNVFCGRTYRRFRRAMGCRGALEENLLKCLSNHAPLLLVSDKEDWEPRPFRFLNTWLESRGRIEAMACECIATVNNRIEELDLPRGNLDEMCIKEKGNYN